MGVLRTGNISEAFKTWVDVTSTSSPRSATVTEEDTTPEAYAEWGDDADFDYNGDFPSGGFEVKNPSEKDRDRYSYSEDGRGFTDYKVYNPDDHSQYVVVRRVTEISFSGPGGAQFVLHLANDTEGTKEGSGQNPTSPDLDKL